MSNKRRKRIGSQKIARNLAIRNRRGAVKLGNPLAGEGVIYRHPHASAQLIERGTQLMADTERHTANYWRGA